MAAVTYETAERIKQVVLDCSIQRFTVDETVEALRQKGYPVDARTVKRYRVKIRDSAQQWISQLAKSRRGDYIAQYRERIFEIETLQRELWNLMKSPETPPGARVKAADVLLQCTSHMVQLYDAMPLVKSLGDYINQNGASTGQQPPPSSSLNEDYDWGSYDHDHDPAFRRYG